MTDIYSLTFQAQTDRFEGSVCSGISTQLKAAVAVNTELIILYWEPGKMITEKQTAWGSKFLPQLSKDLTSEFPNVKGFSERNLALCRQFYQFYAYDNLPQDSILQQAVAKLPLKNNEVDDNIQRPNGEKLNFVDGRRIIFGNSLTCDLCDACDVNDFFGNLSASGFSGFEDLQEFYSRR